LKKKITLTGSFDLPGHCIGISTGMVDHRLAWEINEILKITFVKLPEKIFKNKTTEEDIELTVYYCKETEFGKLFLIKLKYSGLSIIKGLKGFDYLIISDTSDEDMRQLLSRLSMMNIQGGCFLLPIKQNWKTDLRKIVF
jgi:hypothetical protein